MRLLFAFGLLGLTLIYACAWGDGDVQLAYASIAASRGDVGTLRRLEREGLDVNEPFGGTTILADAAAAGHEASVSALVAMGADVNQRGVGQITALMRAALTGNCGTVSTLLRAGADANAASACGYTPLMYAAMSGDVQRVRTLLGAGADPTAVNHVGHTATDCAAENGQAEVARILSCLEPRRTSGYACE
jgi:ankyrin repeat protein